MNRSRTIIMIWLFLISTLICLLIFYYKLINLYDFRIWFDAWHYIPELKSYINSSGKLIDIISFRNEPWYFILVKNIYTIIWNETNAIIVCWLTILLIYAFWIAILIKKNPKFLLSAVIIVLCSNVFLNTSFHFLYKQLLAWWLFIIFTYLVWKHQKKTWAIIPIISYIVFSHRAVSLVMLICLGLYITIYYRNKKNYKYLLFSSVVWVVLTLPYILPIASIQLLVISQFITNSYNWIKKSIWANSQQRDIVWQSVSKSSVSISPLINYFYSMNFMISVLIIIWLVSFIINLKNRKLDFLDIIFIVFTTLTILPINFSNRFIISYNLSIAPILIVYGFRNIKINKFTHILLILLCIHQGIAYWLSFTPYIKYHDKMFQEMENIIPKTSSFMVSTDAYMTTLSQLGYETIANINQAKKITWPKSIILYTWLDLEFWDYFLVNWYKEEIANKIKNLDIIKGKTVYIWFSDWALRQEKLPRYDWKIIIENRLNSSNYELVYNWPELFKYIFRLK